MCIVRFEVRGLIRLTLQTNKNQQNILLKSVYTFIWSHYKANDLKA